MVSLFIMPINGLKENTQNYELSFIRKNEQGEIIDRFVTQPNVIYEELANGKPKFISANPSTKHYLHRDVFTLAVTLIGRL